MVRKMRAWRAPGPDLVRPYWFKILPGLYSSGMRSPRVNGGSGPTRIHFCVDCEWLQVGLHMGLRRG